MVSNMIVIYKRAKEIAPCNFEINSTDEKHLIGFNLD
jgi:hypothetical protein